MEEDMGYHYKVNGQTVDLDIDPSFVAVRFEDDQPKSGRAMATAAAHLGPFARRYEIPGEKLTLIPVGAAGPGPAAGIAEGAIQSLSAQPQVRNVMPVFRVSGNHVVASDRMIVGFDDPSAMDPILVKHRLEKVRVSGDTAVAILPPGADVFALVAAVDAEPEVRYAEPDFITIGQHIPKRSPEVPVLPLSAPLVPRQYALSITKADQAWQLVKGRADIRIAVLDEGVDTRHPDLAGVVVGTFDAADGDSFQEPNAWDGHGTACAGLAAAIGDNNLGIRGVGAGCSILAIRIAYSEYAGGPWRISNEQVVSAIDWAWKNGADVLSNSWGGGPPSNAITEAFERARLRGRSGQGCVIVVAAGNMFQGVSFPATLPTVLSVAASNEYDEAKTPDSCDGEKNWGTNKGPEIDVAAPGVHNLTTDITGTSGYDGGDYIATFNGTSSATPLVAGACALMLSANPGLSEAAVRDIIKNTADKVGQFPYRNGRNDYFGHGRLNVLSAVQAALGPMSGAAATAETQPV
ncbi:S8 family serine peptidase [Azospirillum argentinense]|uniref:Peptidase S8/S53 domain-containing protein n=1 Tax=Azospirillum brasilense TaxID=192 RepID=A0A4D8Q753_AZOBR|nr:S8 family serine peptidase [Azospirillum argentinense]QCO03329.1 hypothetical protein D3867_14590 [Azospirillum argentinense]